MKLAIGFPVVEPTVPISFFMSFTAMDKHSYTLLTPQFPVGRFLADIAAARNSLVHQAREEGCTHLLMLDTDQTYPMDTITRLASHDVDVVGARIHRRWPPFEVLMNRGYVGNYRHVPDEECFSGELVEVDATGTGCLLINMAVFERLERPWFKLGATNKGKPVGEDFGFCHRAREADIRIFVDTAVAVGHLTTMEIGRQAYELFKKAKGFGWKE